MGSSGFFLTPTTILRKNFLSNSANSQSFGLNVGPEKLCLGFSCKMAIWENGVRWKKIQDIDICGNEIWDFDIRGNEIRDFDIQENEFEILDSQCDVI